jgi:hypothetical protein
VNVKPGGTKVTTGLWRVSNMNGVIMRHCRIVPWLATIVLVNISWHEFYI